MKLLIVILTILINNVNAQEIELDADYKPINNAKADPKVLQNFERLKKKGDDIAKEENKAKEESKYTEEYSMMYLKLGQPIININGIKSTGQSTGFGHRRFAETFVYGGEVNLLNKEDLIKTTNINIIMGYQPVWTHRFVPYFLGYIGNSQAKYTIQNSTRSVKANGYVTGLDIGFNIKVLQPIHFMGGMRYEKYNYSKKEIDSMSNQEFYLMLGYEF